MGLNRPKGTMNKNEKILLGVVAAVAVLAAVYLAIIDPAIAKLKPLTDEIAELEKQVTNISSIEYNIEMKQKELDELKVKYNEASKSMPKTDKYPQLIRDLSNYGKTTGSSFVQFGEMTKPEIFETGKDNSDKTKVDENKNMEGLKYFTIQCTPFGSYKEIMDFVALVEKDPRLSEIVTISFDYKNPKEPKGVVAINYYIAGATEDESYNWNSNKTKKKYLID